MNTYYVGSIPVTDELYHHGILGQKWGIRRYQNLDGSLTASGRERYGYDATKVKKKDLYKQYKNSAKSGRLKEASALQDKVSRESEKTDEYKIAKKMSDELYNRQELVKKYYGPYATLYITGEEARAYNKAQERYKEKVIEMMRDHKDEYLSAVLKDMGYEVTDKAKEYVRKIINKYDMKGLDKKYNI